MVPWSENSDFIFCLTDTEKLSAMTSVEFYRTQTTLLHENNECQWGITQYNEGSQLFLRPLSEPLWCFLSDGICSAAVKRTHNNTRFSHTICPATLYSQGQGFIQERTVPLRWKEDLKLGESFMWLKSQLTASTSQLVYTGTTTLHYYNYKLITKCQLQALQLLQKVHTSQLFAMGAGIENLPHSHSTLHGQCSIT